ncbi:MAG: RNA-directed DNA polymerase [Rhodocyclaceae bacterium]|nr:RNA-directed DNA polymerase [Rhodocyclaceae bacterium]
MTVHPAALGCVRGRGVIDHASRHAGQQRLIKLDLRDFFPGIRASRIHALFHSLGYPTRVARYLTGLTTHCSPPRILRTLPSGEFDSPEQRMRTLRRAMSVCNRHLPQGAPSSPALANLCAYRLDLRLAGAALECGARYSRYVDDLSFSGPFDAAHGRRILAMIDDIVRDEGFEPNWRTAAVVGAGTAQRLAGLTINRHPNLPRDEYDRLRAVLTNCLRHGPTSQDKDRHGDFIADAAAQ